MTRPGSQVAVDGLSRPAADRNPPLVPALERHPEPAQLQEYVGLLVILCAEPQASEARHPDPGVDKDAHDRRIATRLEVLAVASPEQGCNLSFGGGGFHHLGALAQW
jgi:hypothetical protein